MLRNLPHIFNSHRLALPLILVLVVLTGLVSWQEYRIRQLQEGLVSYAIETEKIKTKQQLDKIISEQYNIEGKIDTINTRLLRLDTKVFALNYLEKKHRDLVYNHLKKGTHGSIALQSFRKQIDDMRETNQYLLEKMLTARADSIFSKLSDSYLNSYLIE